MPDSRIVDKDIDIPPLLGQIPHEALDGLRVTDIELDGEHLDAVADLGLDLGGELTEGVLAAGRDDEAQVLGAGAGELEGGRAADAGGRAGDDDGLAGEALTGCRGGHCPRSEEGGSSGGGVYSQQR